MEHPDIELMFLLADVARMAKCDFDARAKSLGLTRAQWSILARLVRCQGIQQSRLAELLELKAITVARHIDRLEQGGWVERKADPDDRRVWRLFLTEQAEPVLSQLRELGAQTRAKTLAGISEATRHEILNALKSMKHNLTES